MKIGGCWKGGIRGMKAYPYAFSTPSFSRRLLTAKVLYILLLFLKKGYTMFMPIVHIWKRIFQTGIQKVSMKNV